MLLVSIDLSPLYLLKRYQSINRILTVINQLTVFNRILTTLAKKRGSFHPIAVGETLRRLVSKLCCFSVRSSLPELLLPFGQVGVGVPGGYALFSPYMALILPYAV